MPPSGRQRSMLLYRPCLRGEDGAAGGRVGHGRGQRPGLHLSSQDLPRRCHRPGRYCRDHPGALGDTATSLRSDWRARSCRWGIGSRPKRVTAEAGHGRSGSRPKRVTAEAGRGRSGSRPTRVTADAGHGELGLTSPGLGAIVDKKAFILIIVTKVYRVTYGAHESAGSNRFFGPTRSQVVMTRQ